MTRNTFSYCLLCLLFASNFLFAQPKSSLGGLPGTSMRMGYGAYGIGAGNALSSMKTDMISGYYNPALTPFQQRPFAMASMGFLSHDRFLNFVGYTQSLPPSAGLSVGILNAGVRNIEGRDRNGRPTQIYSTSENAFLLSFGLQMSDHLAIGVSPKIFYYSLFEGISSTTMGFDLGGYYIISPKWAVAIVLQDLGSKYIWETSNLYGTLGNLTREPFPLRKRIAIGFRDPQLKLYASTELEYIGKVPILRIGSNIGLSDYFELRGGIDQISWTDDILPKPSVGFSVNSTIGTLKPAVIYAFVFEPYALSGIHMISLTIHFP